jgi:threonine synthase
MKFRSTRNSGERVGFLEAVESGLASDGGLYVPCEFPSFRDRLPQDQSFSAVATQILSEFMAEDFSPNEISELIQRAFRFPIPLKAFDSHTSILELFHGPTAAFKDVAAQFLGEVMGHALKKEKTILVATSGDTGGAVAAAFDGRPGFRVVILFPKDGVSPLQRQQLTCWGPNILSVAVEGSFDDCQKTVKRLLADPELCKQFEFTSANSINLARLLPQSLYYAASSLWWFNEHHEVANYVIPTGNMGNAVAAFWAKAMGFPISKIVMATNANAVVPEYFHSGRYLPQPSVMTLANAMDVGSPSNFERLQDLWPELKTLEKVSDAVSVSDEEIRATIKNVYQLKREILCPHTATAMAVRSRLQGDWIVVSTAHPAKFTEVVEPLIGCAVPVPPSLQSLRDRPTHYREITSEELKRNAIQSVIQQIRKF